MESKELMTNDLPQLSLHDSGNKAMQLMNEFRVFHLPILSREDYIALVSEDDILDWDTPEDSFSHADFLTFRPAVNEQAHAYESLKIMRDFSLSILPVVNNQGKYLGAIKLENIVHFLADNNEISESGAIIVLEIGQNNYSLSEIARICESNNVTILGTSIKTIENTPLLHITIKTNQTEIQHTVATFERYNYKIVKVYNADDNNEDLNDNLKNLLNYINL